MNQQPEASPPDPAEAARAAVERYLQDEIAERQHDTAFYEAKLYQWQTTDRTDDDLVEEAVQAEWDKVKALDYRPGRDAWVEGEEQVREQYRRLWDAAKAAEDGARQLGHDIGVDRPAPLDDDGTDG